MNEQTTNALLAPSACRPRGLRGTAAGSRAMTGQDTTSAIKYTAVVAAWVLIVTAILFGLLWLSQDLPALLAGKAPQSVIDMSLPTNPVHILDLGFFLPAVIVTGVLLLRCRPLAYTMAPSLLVFLLLTGLPILLTPVVQAARGETAAWGVAIPIGTLTVTLLVAVVWLLSTMRAHEGPAATPEVAK